MTQPSDPNELFALWFTPDEIREHFADELVNDLSDETLRAIGWEALNDDRLYNVFHAVLESAVRKHAPEITDENLA